MFDYQRVTIVRWRFQRVTLCQMLLVIQFHIVMSPPLPVFSYRLPWLTLPVGKGGSLWSCTLPILPSLSLSLSLGFPEQHSDVEPKQHTYIYIYVLFTYIVIYIYIYIYIYFVSYNYVYIYIYTYNNNNYVYIYMYTLYIYILARPDLTPMKFSSISYDIQSYPHHMAAMMIMLSGVSQSPAMIIASKQLWELPKRRGSMFVGLWTIRWDLGHLILLYSRRHLPTKIS